MSLKVKQIINLVVPLILSIPLMITEMVTMISGQHINTIAYDWIAFVFATITIFYFGFEHYKYCFINLFKYKKTGMSTLITLSTFMAYSYSVYLLIYKTIHFAQNKQVLHIMSFFEIGATIIAIVNIGEYISYKIQLRSNKDINKLSELLVNEALKYDIDSKKYYLVDTKLLNINDHVFVKKGTKIPIDGIVVENETEVDESLLTGESNSILKKVGDKVIGGTINLSNDFVMAVTKLHDNTIVNSIINNVKQIDINKSKTQKIIDKVANWFTPTILICGVLAFLVQMFFPDIFNISNNSGFLGNTNLEWINGNNEWSIKAQKGLYFFIATLTISCPCAIGIAAPLAYIIGVSKGAKNGIIYNNTEVFEKIKKIKKIYFDKTGTLTTGKLQLVHLIGDIKYISNIYHMEKISFHPIAKSFINYVDNNNITVKNSANKNNEYNEIAGVGIVNKNNTEMVTSLKYALDNKIEFEKNVFHEYTEYVNNLKEEVLQTIICFVKNNKIVNVIFFEDEIRSDAIEIIKKFKKMKIDVAMITGDNQKNAEYVAKKLSINEVHANISPVKKAEIIKECQSKKIKAAYVGDGINDLIALKQSDLSFSMTSENEVAKNISDINLIYLNINSVYNSIRIAKQTRLLIILNLLWAFGYNIVTVPLAVLGFIPAFIGIYIMMLSDITVNLNSLIFKFIK